MEENRTQMNIVRKYIGLIMLGGMLTAGCGNTEDPQPIPQPLKELHILNWADYITTSTLEEFERRSGCEVFLHAYNSTDEMLSRLKSNTAGYDIVVVEDRLISALAELKLIQKISAPSLKGFEHIDPEMTNLPCDPGNQFSVPYNWGTTLIAYRSDRISPTHSWASLFDPQYTSEVIMLDLGQECFEIALRALGQSINSNDPQWLKNATELLKKQATSILGYQDVYGIKDALIAGECSLAPVYSGDAAELAAANTNINYFIPIEGAPMWIDGFTLSRDAQNINAAKAFIEFMLEPEVAAANASAMWYASANLKAKEFMAREILEDPSLYPPPEVHARLEFIKPLATSHRSILNKNWNSVQALNRKHRGGAK